MKYYYNHEFPYKELLSQSTTKNSLPFSPPTFMNSSLKEFLDRSMTYPARPFEKVLVLGCGLGETCEYLFEKGFSTYGIDISNSAIGYAEKSGEKKKYEISYFVMDITQMNIP